MTIDLEERLRVHYDRRTAALPTTGPGLDALLLPTLRQPDADRPSHLRMAIIGTAAAALIVGLAALAMSRPDNGSSGVAGEPDVVALEPVVTLPESADLSDEPPATALATEPVEWYRLAPDLDVSWYAPPDGMSMLCWRTPVAQDCVEDHDAHTLPLTVATGGGQTLVITSGSTDSRSLDDEQLDLVLDDGTVLTAPIIRDDQTSWGVSRFAIPVGRRMSGFGDASLTAANPVEVTGATLPPSADLVDIPVTIVAGPDLSYWRWFPDLDISERQTAADGSELCWRTPAGTGCIDEDFASPKVGLIPTDAATIVLAQPALVPIVPTPSDPLAARFEIGPRPTRVVATLSDGTTATAEVTYGVEFGVGWARIPTPNGITVTNALSE